ncbi:MAG: S1 RNA-binding domain-containing protein [Holosporales bacterium]|jgi:ribonuclease E|nr:S1 RNA-binding domain-containing protein [Holosporales bacterium]
MSGKLLIDASCADETRIAVVGADGRLEIFETEYSSNRPIKGNIYLAKVVRIEPSIQAAFIDYGGNKHGFLPLTEIHYEYFNKNVAKAIGDRSVFDGNDEGDATEKQGTNLPRIQEVISQKQIILVQAEKEIRGNKCAFFSTFISLPGMYCVLMPNPPTGM